MRKIELIGMINYLKNNILLFLIFTIGSIGLYSWFVGDFFLSTIINSYVSMAQSTSVIFCVISILLFLHLNFNKSKFLGLVISLFSVVIIIYCSLIIYKYNFGLQVKLENFYIVKPKTIGKILYGRMSPVTSILFVLSNINILLIFWKIKKRKLVSDLINFIILFITFIMLIGYLYHTPILYASKVIPIALPTAICFLFLSITFFNIHGLPFNFGKDKTLKYQLIKSFIPLIISIILIQGYFDSSVLNHQENKTLYVAIFVIISIIISIILIIRNSITIDKKLKNSEFLLKASEEQYRLLFKYMPVPTYTWQKVKDDLILIDYNEKADSFTNGNQSCPKQFYIRTNRLIT